MYDLIEHLVVGVIAERDERIVFANRTFAELLDYRSPTVLLGRSVWELVHSSAEAAARTRIRERANGAHVASHMTVLKRTDGAAVPVCVFAYQVGEGEDDSHRSRLATAVVIPVTALPMLSTCGCSACAPSANVPWLDALSALDAQRQRRNEVFERLTPREAEIVESIASGMAVASVARSLGISPNTVRNHLKSVFRKLGVRSQAELLSRLIRARPLELLGRRDFQLPEQRQQAEP
jgi:PAS domain S-box-containing protein